MSQLKSGHFYQSYSVHAVSSSSCWWLPSSSSQCLMHLKILPNFCPFNIFWTNHNVLKYFSTTYPGTDLVLCARKQPHKIEWICMPWTQGITVTSFFWSNWKAYMNEDLLFKTMLLSLSCKKQCKIFIISNSVSPIKHQRET